VNDRWYGGSGIYVYRAGGTSKGVVEGGRKMLVAAKSLNSGHKIPHVPNAKPQPPEVTEQPSLYM